MNFKRLQQLRLAVALMALWACGSVAKAQTNAQVLYDFGSDRKYVTLTLEMFKPDKWGSTYFFVDHDFNYDKMVVGEKNISQGGTYTEISRALNFWQESKFKNWSLHVEYNGGITKNYPINNAWLFGVEYLIHDKAYNNTLTLEALYKTIRKTGQSVPMQFTAVWTCNDIFGVKGLKFDGFADFWWETHNVDYQEDGSSTRKHTIFTTEPQIWYKVGQHFGCDNLSVGGEVELSNNFGSKGGFWCRPCLGAKWDF